MFKSADEVFERVCKLSKLDRRTLCTYSTDRQILQWRWLAAYLLSKFWNDHDHGRVQQRLQCSKVFVEQARKIASEASAEGEVMRSRLMRLNFEPPKAPAVLEAAPPEDQCEEKSETAESSLSSLVLQAAEEQFQTSRDDIAKLSHAPALASIRRAVALAASNVEIGDDEIASMLNCKIGSVRTMLSTGSYDYLYDEEFRSEVDAICARLGVKASVPT